MLILFISISLLITSFCSFTLGYQILTLNRVVISTPVAVVETSIIQSPNIDEINHLFSKVEFENKINEYFAYELSNFKDKYELDFYYFNDEDLSICMYENCQSVWVKFDANLLFDYHYERNLIFRVKYHYYEA